MIFGRGTEKTDEAIIEEYHRYETSPRTVYTSGQ